MALVSNKLRCCCWMAVLFHFIVGVVAKANSPNQHMTTDAMQQRKTNTKGAVSSATVTVLEGRQSPAQPRPSEAKVLSTTRRFLARKTQSTFLPISYAWKTIDNGNLYTILKILRGGAQDYDDEYDEEDEYDNEYDEYEEEDDDRKRISGKPGRPNYDHHMNRPPPPSRRRRPKHWSQRLASQSVKLTGQVALNTIKGSSNLVYHVIRPKHVDRRELEGLWRLDQQLVNTRGRGGNGKPLVSVASLELNPRAMVLTVGGDSSDKKDKPPPRFPFTFSKTRLGSFQTEFVAPAFLIGDTPQLFGYRGTWQRKLADKSVLKFKGDIYKVRKLRRPPKKQKSNQPLLQYELIGKPIGTFEARRRLRLEENYDDDEYDEYDDDGYDGADNYGDVDGYDDEEADDF